MPASIPFEPPVTRATLPASDYVCICCHDYLRVIDGISFGLFCPECSSDLLFVNVVVIAPEVAVTGDDVRSSTDAGCDGTGARPAHLIGSLWEFSGVADQI
jgi:hypothetical protein